MSNLTQFDYLLNRFEHASQADKPADHNYGEHRRALFAYVRDLEAKVFSQPTVFDPAVLTNDRLRAIARQAENRSGPSDPTSRSDYVLEGWREAEKHHGIKT